MFVGLGGGRRHLVFATATFQFGGFPICLMLPQVQFLAGTQIAFTGMKCGKFQGSRAPEHV